jgi:hypothetical protein
MEWRLGAIFDKFGGFFAKSLKKYNFKIFYIPSHNNPTETGLHACNASAEICSAKISTILFYASSSCKTMHIPLCASLCIPLKERTRWRWSNSFSGKQPSTTSALATRTTRSTYSSSASASLVTKAAQSCVNQWR